MVLGPRVGPVIVAGLEFLPGAHTPTLKHIQLLRRRMAMWGITGAWGNTHKRRRPARNRIVRKQLCDHPWRDGEPRSFGSFNEGEALLRRSRNHSTNKHRSQDIPHGLPARLQPQGQRGSTPRQTPLAPARSSIINRDLDLALGRYGIVDIERSFRLPRNSGQKPIPHWRLWLHRGSDAERQRIGSAFKLYDLASGFQLDTGREPFTQSRWRRHRPHAGSQRLRDCLIRGCRLAQVIGPSAKSREEGVTMLRVQHAERMEHRLLFQFFRQLGLSHNTNPVS